MMVNYVIFVHIRIYSLNIYCVDQSHIRIKTSKSIFVITCNTEAPA